MRRWSVETEARVRKVYTVEAETAEDARQKVQAATIEPDFSEDVTEETQSVTEEK